MPSLWDGCKKNFTDHDNHEIHQAHFTVKLTIDW